MNTKTWKIGERCRGGIITVNVTPYFVYVYGKDWPAGASRKDCLNLANVWSAEVFNQVSDDWLWDLDDHLNWLTNSYFAEKIMDWVKTKTCKED